MDDRPELVFALVGAAGTRLDDLSSALKDELTTFGYQSFDIRLSELLVNFTGWSPPKGTTESERIRHLQDMGDAFRGRAQDGAALARAGIVEIRKRRASVSGSPDRPASGYAYIVRQLKHPDEVDLLREVYGPSFLLVAGHAPRPIRSAELSRQLARKDSMAGQEWRFEENALQIIRIDEKQESDFGQNTRDTYPRADFFANLGISRGEHEVRRFVDLVFAHPFHTPTYEEYAMYQASAASLRSSDDNRQVGAAIVRLTYQDGGKLRNADVIAVGMNEVPRGGGGFYWDQDSPDHRDQALLRNGEDRAREIKVSALAELIEKIRERQWLRESVADQSASNLAQQLLDDLRRTQFMEIGEFSRPVHAEMASLIDAARRGVAVQGHSMYVTTFPCHNCAKHIIAAGLTRVVYLEPYPKSRALNLHGEEIALDSIDGKEQEGKVVFLAFSGIAPRQYRQLFSMSERGAKKGVSLKDWEVNRRSLSPRFVMVGAALTYLPAETRELKALRADVYSWDMGAICPTGQPESQGDLNIQNPSKA